MSDRPWGEGWWLASDGKWYPPELRSGDPLPPPPVIPEGSAAAASLGPPLWPQAAPPAPVWRAPEAKAPGSGLTATLIVLVALSGVGLAAYGVIAFMQAAAFDAYWEAPVGTDEAERATFQTLTDINDGLGVLGALALFAVTILLLTWLYVAYRRTGVWGATGTRWNEGWALWGWFIPIACFVIPKLVVNEIDRIADPVDAPLPVSDTWRINKRAGTSDWWWISLMVGGALIVIGRVFGDPVYASATEYSAGLRISAVGGLVLSLSALLMLLFFGNLGSRLRSGPSGV